MRLVARSDQLSSVWQYMRNWHNSECYHVSIWLWLQPIQIYCIYKLFEINSDNNRVGLQDKPGYQPVSSCWKQNKSIGERTPTTMLTRGLTFRTAQQNEAESLRRSFQGLPSKSRTGNKDKSDALEEESEQKLDCYQEYLIWTTILIHYSSLTERQWSAGGPGYNEFCFTKGTEGNWYKVKW